MSETKTHYRKVFKSEHLGVADLEEMIEDGKRLVFTIKEVKQYFIDPEVKGSGVVVAGKRISANIASFKEGIKPLVLNSTNSKVVRSFCANSSFVEDWGNVLIELYIDASVRMKRDIVSGVRIKPKQPVSAQNKPVLNPESEKWETAKEAVVNGMTFKDMSKHYQITQENYDLLCG